MDQRRPAGFAESSGRRLAASSQFAVLAKSCFISVCLLAHRKCRLHLRRLLSSAPPHHHPPRKRRTKLAAYPAISKATGGRRSKSEPGALATGIANRALTLPALIQSHGFCLT